MRGPVPRDSALLRVKVQPRAGRDEVVGWQGTVLRLRVSAAPVDDEANRAVRALLARSLGVPPSAVTLVRGAHGRDKLVRIQGCSLEVLQARINPGRP